MLDSAKSDMPPKKKARLPSRAASTLSAETPAETVSVVEDKVILAKEDLSPRKEIVTDPWTDEQEISLFKGMVKWKPVGSFSYYTSGHCANHI